MLQRVPEPELMDEPEQARAYAAEDFSAPNALFLERFRQLHPGPLGPARVLDLGCGPADICVRLARAYPDCQIDALDGSAAMLVEAAQVLMAAPDVAGRIQLVEDLLPSARLPAAAYDVVISNSLLHHLGDPAVFWDSLRRAARPGAWVLVMDLFRPESEQAIDDLVAVHAADSPAVLRRDFRNSLAAAFTPEEVAEQLRGAGLAHLVVERVSDRHLTVSGRR